MVPAAPRRAMPSRCRASPLAESASSVETVGGRGSAWKENVTLTGPQSQHGPGTGIKCHLEILLATSTQEADRLDA
eukprot:12835208-Alexandrium_andersonii.AAC.1